jgi:hypothetical protein
VVHGTSICSSIGISWISPRAKSSNYMTDPVWVIYSIANCQITRLIIYIYYISYIIYDHHPSSYSWKGKSEKYGTMIQNQQLETEMGDFALPSFAS